MKVKTLKVSYNNDGRGNEVYRVIRVTDSVEYTPGQFLNKEQVNVLCNKVSWKVIIDLS